MLRPHLRLPLVISAMLAMLPGIAPGIIRAETIAYWRFENGAANTVATGAGSILDLSGHGLNGTPVGNTVYRTDVPVNPVPATGAANTRSLDIASYGAGVTVADNPLFALTKSLTLEAFIRPRTGSIGDYNWGQIIFRGDDRGGLDPYYLGVNQSSLYFTIIQANDPGQYAQLSYGLQVFDTWMHVAGTLDDATGAMNLYVNGVSVASTITSVRPLGPLTGPNPGVGIGSSSSMPLPSRRSTRRG
jgi:Concanavalin A-like lectin/glucanases superfamily